MRAGQARPNLRTTISPDRTRKEGGGEEGRHTIQRVIDESEEKHGGGCKSQLCECEITHTRIRHLEITGRGVGGCMHCTA